MGVGGWGLGAKLAPKKEIEVTTYLVTADQWDVNTDAAFLGPTRRRCPKIPLLTQNRRT